MADLYVGLMSGTSMDGISAAVVSFNDRQPVLHGTLTQPYPNELRQRLLAIADPRWRGSLPELLQLDQLTARAFADSALQLLKQLQLTSKDIRAIGSHGQTICHQPEGHIPSTLQIGDPNLIAELTGITTISDFRRRDMAAGGQGAPLVPVFHRWLFRSQQHDQAVLNLGGIANLTLIPADSNAAVTGFDCGPANILMDAWTALHQQMSYDHNGDWARGGEVVSSLLEQLLSDEFFSAAPPKSTGRERFNLTWLQQHLEQHDLSLANVQTTLTELTARSVTDALIRHLPNARQLNVCGGGVHNRYLLERIQHHLPDCELLSTAARGIDPDYMEAIAFAWLARRTLQEQPGNLPEVTGARGERILGGIYQA